MNQIVWYTCTEIQVLGKNVDLVPAKPASPQRTSHNVKKNRERKRGKKATTYFCAWERSRVSEKTTDHKSPCEGYSHTVSMVTKLWGVAGWGCSVRWRSGRRWSAKRLYRLCNHRNLLSTIQTAQMATGHFFLKFYTGMGGRGLFIWRLTSEPQSPLVLMSTVLSSSTNVIVIRSNSGPRPAALPRQRLCSEVKRQCPLRWCLPIIPIFYRCRVFFLTQGCTYTQDVHFKAFI